MLWDCDGECKYECMHTVTDWLWDEYNTIFKFYGHWPYKRIWGIQEPAASLFSLGNMIPHVHNLYYNAAAYRRPGIPFGKALMAYSWVALLAWTASTLFHARKIEPFISFDYSFAFLFISFGLWIAIKRLWFEFRSLEDKLLSGIFDIAFGSCVLYQFISVLSGKVSFSNHMDISIALSVCHAVIWLVFCCVAKSPTRLLCLFCQAWFGAASLLELYDFPPYFKIFDAHALWHAATIPLGFFWFQFWIRDSNYWSSLHASSNVRKGT